MKTDASLTLNLPLPHPDNDSDFDVMRIRESLMQIDAAIASKEDELGYVPLPSDTNTDVIEEGQTNLYFSGARVLGTLLAGLSSASSAAIVAGDTVLSALGKLQKQITELINGKQSALTSGENIKTVNGVSLMGPGDVVTGLTRVDFATATQTATAGNDYWASYAGVVTLIAPAATNGSVFQLSPVNGRIDNVIDFGSATVLGFGGATATGLITLTLGAPMKFEYSAAIAKWVMR